MHGQRPGVSIDRGVKIIHGESFASSKSRSAISRCFLFVGRQALHETLLLPAIITFSAETYIPAQRWLSVCPHAVGPALHGRVGFNWPASANVQRTLFSLNRYLREKYAVKHPPSNFFLRHPSTKGSCLPHRCRPFSSQSARESSTQSFMKNRGSLTRENSQPPRNVQVL